MTGVEKHSTLTFRAKDVDICYRLFGTAGNTPIVILHGLSYFSFDWIGPANELAYDREVAAVDMRGFGDSGRSKDYSVQANADDLVRLLDHRGWSKAILLGHSMGGRHCAYCAATYSGRVEKLVLADWSPENAPEGSRKVAEAIAGTPDVFTTIDEAMVYFGIDPASPRGTAKRPRFAAYLNKVSGGYAVKRDPHFKEQFKQQLVTGKRHGAGVDLWATLAAVQCPILVIRATRSHLFARESVDRVKATNSNIDFVEIESGHDIANDNPGALVDAVTGFLTA